MALRLLFKKLVGLWVAAIVLCAPITSRAWGAGGHMMVAYIAYKRLNPRARAKANALLAIRINPSSVSAQSKDFVNASHWADDLRPFPEFDELKQLHFIDKHFSTDGTPLPPEPSPNLVTALDENVKILKTSNDPQEKARALRLIIHFVGDIHQPLHCASRVSADNPKGDLGGNLISVSALDKNGQPRKTNLHSYWDGGLASFPPTGANFKPPALSLIAPAASKAMTANKATNPDLKLIDPYNFKSWADESNHLAQDVVYNGVANGGKLPALYTQRGAIVASKRVAWAGYRLAALLNDIWP